MTGSANQSIALQKERMDCFRISPSTATFIPKNMAGFKRPADFGGVKTTMFSHIMIGTNDLEKARTFYDALLGTLDVPPGRVDRHRIFWRTKTGTFSVTRPINGEPACHANGGTIGFSAASKEQADAFHAAGLAHGGKTCEDPPGIREGSGVKLYIAYLRDPDGNKICALHRVA